MDYALCMCGRFYLDAARDQLKTHYQVSDIPGDLVPRFNIAPSQDILAVREIPNHERILSRLHWGLIPSWAKEEKTHYAMINARAETLAGKPAFRTAYQRRRCLIPVSGFYEWQPMKGVKQPYAITLKDGNLFSLAGLWEHWDSPQGKTIESCTIIVTDANALVAPIHDRMPVIIDPAQYAKWLDPELQDTEMLNALLQPYSAEAMTAYPVTRQVNNPGFDEPRCIEPVSEPGT